MSRYFLYSKFLWISTFVLLFCASLLTFTSTVHAVINHPPTVESQPETTATAGVAYEYVLHATDRDNDPVEFSLTSSPDGATIADGTINWTPTKTETYNFVVEITDGQNGYGSQAWQVSVVAGLVEYIIVTPNDRPTIIPIGDNQQFSAEAYDEFNNAVSDVSFKWTADEEIGSVDTEGLFTARAGGIGFVAASVGDVKNSIGVIGEDASDDESTTNTINVEAEEPAEAEEETIPITEPVAEENTADEEADEEVETESVDNEDTIVDSIEVETEENDNADECTNWPHWVILILLVVYGGALIGYFQYEKKQKTGGWWIAPALLTAIGLVIYYKYVCAGTYMWWPWILLLIGIIITMNYKLRMKTPDGDSQNELPF